MAGKRAINRYMNRNALSVIRDVDVVIFVLDRKNWNEDDQLVEDAIQSTTAHLIIAVNKVDLIKDKGSLLPLLASLQARSPISGEKRDNLEALEADVCAHLPKSPFYFQKDQVTDRSERFLASEIIREKLMRQLGDELPYALTIQIDAFKEERGVAHITATIFVEREGQKSILIGSQGKRLKQIGIEARKDLEALLAQKVMLNTWVKVKSGWSDSDRALKSLGYDDI